ncbi:MAG: hypothetical protein JNN30_16535 [Rhodanobacteraceae bacterium]|nr:hypothetical protein [Rhodanobacteraceae bacterium]
MTESDDALPSAGDDVAQPVILADSVAPVSEPAPASPVPSESPQPTKGEAAPLPPHEILQQLEDALETDFLYYIGEVNRAGYSAVTAICDGVKRRKNAFLALITTGGDPDAAYRIARCLRHNYETLTIFTPGLCKSAGTLICLSANEIVVGDEGELGPLDIQINKPDEILEAGSGLDVGESLDILKQNTITTFEEFLVEIRFANGISTKTAAELAAKLAIGIFTPIYGQIDPLRYGEIQRAMRVARLYGERLNQYGKILKHGVTSLNRLINSYPSHTFVIDRKEAKEIFGKVRAPDQQERAMGRLLASMAKSHNAQHVSQPKVDLVRTLLGGKGT